MASGADVQPNTALSGGPNAATPAATPAATAPATPVALPPQTPDRSTSSATSVVSPAVRLQSLVEAYGVPSQTSIAHANFAPNLSEVHIHVGTLVGVDTAGNSKFKAFATTAPQHKKADKFLVKNLSVDHDVDLCGLDNYGNKNKVAMKNRSGNLPVAEQNLVRNVTYQLLHSAFEKQPPGNNITEFREYVEGAKNCVNSEGECVVRTAYQGARFVRRCADGSIEFLATKGKLSPEMNFDAELTFSYWKYKGNYGVSANVHRIIVNTTQEQGQATFLSGATKY